MPTGKPRRIVLRLSPRHVVELVRLLARAKHTELTDEVLRQALAQVAA